jgi:hypothetical protein
VLKHRGPWSRAAIEASHGLAFLPVAQRAQDAFEYPIQVAPDVFGQIPEHEVAVFLKQLVLAAVTSVDNGIRQMLWAVELDGDPFICAEKIDFHLTPSIESDREVCVEMKAAAGLGKGLEPAIEERFGSAACSIGPFVIWRNRPAQIGEQSRQWSIDAIANESLQACRERLHPCGIAGE